MKVQPKLILFWFIIFISPNQSHSQEWNRFWCFGDSAGIDFRDKTMPAISNSFQDCARSCASIGDSANGLLMYAHSDYWPYYVLGSTRTTVIRNRNHNIMQNGDSLIEYAGLDGLCFLPFPGNDSLFYLFQWGMSPDSGIYYSTIDPHYNNDEGIVLSKNIQLPLQDNWLHFGIIAIKHGNGRDWWVICRNWNNTNKFNIFLITPYGISSPLEQFIGTNTTSQLGGLCVSKNGNKIGLTNFTGLVEVYNFDRCLGELSSPRTLKLQSSINQFGCEFSPSGQFLYVANTDNIFGDSLRVLQYNLIDTSNIPFEVYKENVPASGGNLRLGPDDKIYLTCLYSFGWPYVDSVRNMYNENLSVINSPDSLGAACDFSPFSFYLGGKRTYWSLPSNPNYSLKAEQGSVCDSLYISIDEISNKDFIVYPNPGNGYFRISSTDNSKFNLLEIFSVDGKLLFQKHASSINTYIDIHEFNNGIYILRIDKSNARKIVLHK